MPLTTNPWPGPRPLGESDALIGREREVYELVDRCATYDVILVTARSGVGKTSFVEAGGRKALHDAGYEVPTVRRWRDLLDDPNVVVWRGHPPEQHAEALYRALLETDPVSPEEVAADPDGYPTPVDALYERARDTQMVVVVDQVEELLRFGPEVGEALLRVAGETARDARVPHVIVARSEYLDQLRAAEVRRAKVWPLYVRELTGDAALTEIVAGPARPDLTVTDEAIGEIIRWWHQARDAAVRGREKGSVLFGGVGLLHLQALLWSLGEWAVASELADRLDQPDLERFAVDREREADAPDDGEPLGARMVEEAVIRYVAHQVERSVRASATSDGSPLTWRNGPRLALARIAPVLSSGGYKVPQALGSLVPVCYRVELARGEAEAYAKRVVAGDDFDGFVPGAMAPAGLAADWPVSAVLREMRDALLVALDAMSASDVNILRQFNLARQPVFELVHDGFGPALERWSETFLDSPLATIGVISALPGAAILTGLSPSLFTANDGTVDPGWGAVRLVPWSEAVEREDDADASIAATDPAAVAEVDGLRWASNYIGPPAGGDRTEFRDLVLRDCDFTGAAFVACDLRNVRFERCTFRGAAMIGCSFDGVRFVGDAEDGDRLDLLTIKGSLPGARVTFSDLQSTTGLFLQDLGGGTWTLEDCRATHVAVTASQPTVIVGRRGRLSHLTIDGAAIFEPDGDPELPFSELQT